MKDYLIHRLDTKMTYSERAKSPALAMVKMMDKYYRPYWGPQLVDGLFEIYSQDGTRLKFSVQEIV